MRESGFRDCLFENGKETPSRLRIGNGERGFDVDQQMFVILRHEKRGIHCGGEPGDGAEAVERSVNRREQTGRVKLNHRGASGGGGQKKLFHGSPCQFRSRRQGGGSGVERNIREETGKTFHRRPAEKFAIDTQNFRSALPETFRERTAFFCKFRCGKGGGRIGGKQNHCFVEHGGICNFAVGSCRFGTVGKHPGNVVFKIRMENRKKRGGKSQNKQSSDGERPAEQKEKNMTQK